MYGKHDYRSGAGALGESIGLAAADEQRPFFFRDCPVQLYACHHRPAAAAAGFAPAVICNAVGHEYERCHKATRQLAVQIARAGADALRFDYLGTGDSAGGGEIASLARWHADIHDAIDEIRFRTGKHRVSLMGLRVGAALAAQLAARRDDVENLVLYAPPVDADSLIQEWYEAQATHDRVQSSATTATATTEILGYPLTDAFRSELQTGLDLPAPSAGVRRVLLCTEQDVDAWQGVTQRLGHNGASVTVETEDVPAIWRREPMEALVPFKLIRRILAWLKDGAS